MGWLLIGGVGALIVFLALRYARKTGEATAHLQNSNEVIEDVEQANEAERGLDDPSERQRVRKKFTRK